ncbi:TetR family transcriptional regulator [Aliihoeflea aestuarii]|jgi:AcrR family transcriptional regulator|uniref:TetR/AcrR family transcriptional regulator n=1 Tax=Aliihoeflea aestuarii TaxID=453840 RepID=UPI0020958631|nr:TetR/AcrR family transcriptional regulator [Aliihoeflea aestuarii]MCO6392958.1 TetR family transcriptional regulator [Aliihoeflea aestuarii]
MKKTRTARGEDTRNAILAAAEAEIGKRGFASSSITDITRAAGIAQGTFYIYFSTKDMVFRELVALMGRLTRARLSEAVAGIADRVEAERVGLGAFLRFVAERPSLYNIVEEARFVAPDAYRDYFSNFAKAYAQNLAEAAQDGTIRPGNAEIRAWALMGMAKTLGERFCVWQQQDDLDPDAVVAEVFDMLEKGLRP